MSRRLLACLLTALLLAGCTYPDMPSVAEPSGPAPEPVPSGVLYGRVLRQDGRAATRSTVEAFQMSDEDKVRTGVAVVSLGLFCLVPGFCPSPVPAKVDAGGRYVFPTDKIKPVKNVTVTARHAAEAGQVVGPEVAVSLVHDPGTQQRVPDLRYWEPAIQVSASTDRATISWSPLPAGADYALWTVTGQGRLQAAGVTTRDTTATLDLRPYEDQPTALIIVGTITGDASFAYRSGSVPLPSAGAPPSRGSSCMVGDPGQPLVPAVSPCPLTDGNLTTNAAVTTPCPSGGSTSSACPQPTRHRLCIGLSGQRPISMIVYRTPFLTDGTTVEVSSTGSQFRTVGQAPASTDGDIRVTPVSPAITAGVVCVRNDRFGFSGAMLDELSAW